MRIALPSRRILALVASSFLLGAVRAVPADAGPSGDGYWSSLQWPGSRYGHCAVHDAARDRMIVLGGYDGTGYEGTPAYATPVWILTLSNPLRWTRLLPDAPGGSRPIPRYTQAAIFDPVRDRMIVFGGFNSRALDDLWELSLAGVPEWTLLTASAPRPAARYRHTAVFDPVRDRMIVFGGTNDTTLFGDVWALSLSGNHAWNEIVAPGGPSPRYRHSAIYDPARDRMIVCGGRGDSTDFSDVWALNLTGVPAWSEIQPAVPLPRTRASHTAVYDPAGDRMVVYGGVGPTRNDVRALALAGPPTWSLLEPAGSAPAGHSSHTAILDPVRHRMVVFAGMSDSGLATGDVSVLDMGGTPAWSSTVKPLAPTTMAIHTSIYDPVASRIIPFGGMTTFAGPINETWAVSLDPAPLWSRLEPAGVLPAPRHSHVAIYDRLRERMVVYGGFPTSLVQGYLNEVWTLSLSGNPTWAQVPSSGGRPSVHGTAARAFYDPIEDRMIFYLPLDQTYGFPTIWAQLMSQLGQWQYLSTGDVHPPNSESPNVIYDPLRDRMILFGGCLSNGMPENVVWAISLRTRLWTQIPTLGPTPVSRCRYSAVYDPIRDRMLMIGGRGPQGHDTNEVWELTLADPPTWRQLSFSHPAPPTLTAPTAVAIPERDWIVVEGGYYGSSATNDTWILEGGRPSAPACQCPGAAAWAGDGSLTLRHAVSQPLESSRKLTWTLKSARAWPGFPRQGVVTVGAALPETVSVQIAPPDSAAAGTNQLTFGVSFTGADGAEVVCTRNLHVSTSTLDVTTAAAPAFLRIRPNPARRQMTAMFSMPAPGRATLALYDMAGRRISRRELSLGEGDQAVPVAPGARLAPGVYIVQLTAGAGTLRARAVVID